MSILTGLSIITKCLHDYCCCTQVSFLFHSLFVFSKRKIFLPFLYRLLYYMQLGVVIVLGLNVVNNFIVVYGSKVAKYFFVFKLYCHCRQLFFVLLCSFKCWTGFHVTFKELSIFTVGTSRILYWTWIFKFFLVGNVTGKYCGQ